MSNCFLCSEDVGHAGRRTCMVDLCDLCARADPLAPRVQHLGIGLTKRTWTKRTGGDNPKTIHHTEVKGWINTRFAATVEVTREGTGHRIIKFFGGYKNEVQGGDPLFDDTLFVRVPDEHKPLAAELLADEAVQSTLLEIFTEFGPFVLQATEAGCLLELHTAYAADTPGISPRSSHQFLIAVLMRQIQLLEAGQPTSQ